DPKAIHVLRDGRGDVALYEIERHHGTRSGHVRDRELTDAEAVVVPLEAVEIAQRLLWNVVARCGEPRSNPRDVEGLKILRRVRNEDSPRVAVAERNRLVVALRSPIVEIDVAVHDRNLNHVVLSRVWAVELDVARGVGDGGCVDETGQDLLNTRQ